MREIEVNFRQFRGEEKILFPESGVLHVKPTYRKEWSHSHSPLSVDLIVGDTKIEYKNEWHLDMHFESVAERIGEHLAKNGYYAEIVDYDKHWYGTERDWEIKFDTNNRYSILYDMLTATWMPRFEKIINMSNDYVLVDMGGHPTGGSNRSPERRSAEYIEEMRTLIPCNIDFIEIMSEGYGGSTYRFKIHTKEVKRFKKRTL